MGTKRIAIIGGGPSGIGAIKSINEEGMEPVCFERSSHYGGLWRYHEDDIDGLASVMKTTIINTSKEMSALSDFPPAEHLPNYMHNTEIYKMLTEYVKKFDLLKHMHFNKEVIEVNLADDYDETGRLSVTVRDTISNEVTKDVYDCVTVCIGHHVYPNMPNFPGMDKFKGTIMHTHSLKTVDKFKDEIVVVVGAGNSAMDAAVEISSIAKQVYLSTRRGTWVLPRVGPSGIPLDFALGRRFLDVLFKYVPFSISCWVSERMLNQRFDHELYSLKPKHRIWCQHPTVSDSIPIKLLSGTVKVKKNIKEFTENGVIFEDEDDAVECNSVIFATGYKIKFPFINESLAAIKNNQVHLYKYVFPPHLKHPTLAFIGLIQSVGAGFPIGELQTRWASLIFNRKLSLPNREQMEKDIRRCKEINSKRYVKSERHTIQVNYIEYLDDIASLIGAKPNFFKMFFTDPPLFWALFLGASVPYQYRLQGPHPWPGARKAIMESNKRVYAPLNTSYSKKKLTFDDITWQIFLMFFIIMLAILIYVIIKFVF